jgi:ketosteroid isomerase-like protein
MMSLSTTLRASLIAAVLGAVLIRPSAHSATEPGPSITFATDPVVAAQQRAAFDVVHRYEQLLNAGDTTGILELFAPDGIAEWNDKPTFSTLQEKRDAYDALFRIAKFTTVFGYAGIDVHGDTAVVRTYHHKGATVLEGGKEVVDLNREVFVLRRIDGRWRISLYIFNINPVQGEG